MRIKVNNIELYYEKYGKGRPIILIHGNQESHKIFDNPNKLKIGEKIAVKISKK